jgi:hypothetical protein
MGLRRVYLIECDAEACLVVYETQDARWAQDARDEALDGGWVPGEDGQWFCRAHRALAADSWVHESWCPRASRGAGCLCRAKPVHSQLGMDTYGQGRDAARQVHVVKPREDML